jgi:hypothetical protein
MKKLRRPVERRAPALRQFSRGSEQPATHRDCREPHQTGKRERAEHRGRAEIFDSADIPMLLGRDVVGKFFDCGVQKLDGEYDKKRRDHGNVPSKTRRNEKPDRHGQREGNSFLADRGLGFDAVDNPAQRVPGGADNSLHGAVGCAARQRRAGACCGLGPR